MRWRLYLAGFIRIILGIFAFTYPVEALLDLALIWGVAVCLTGINYILLCFNKNYDYSMCPKWFLFLSGLLDLFLGGIMISRLGLTAFMIPIFAAAWLGLEGIVHVALAFRLIKILRRWWLILLDGLLLIALAALMFASPIIGGIYVVSIIASILIVSGIFMIAEGRLLA